jgi:hypothetical protein
MQTVNTLPVAWFYSWKYQYICNLCYVKFIGKYRAVWRISLHQMLYPLHRVQRQVLSRDLRTFADMYRFSPRKDLDLLKKYCTVAGKQFVCDSLMRCNFVQYFKKLGLKVLVFWIENMLRQYNNLCSIQWYHFQGSPSGVTIALMFLSACLACS